MSTLPTPKVKIRTKTSPLIQLTLAVLFACLYAAYSRLARVVDGLYVYFPFESWPEGRANRIPPPPGRDALGLHATEVKMDEAKFARMSEVLVTRYMHFHKSQRFNTSVPKLIYTGEGNRHGFGDRFRGILNAYQLAFISQRVLLIAWRKPFPLDLIFKSAPGVSVMYNPAIDPGPMPLTSDEKAYLNRTGNVTTWGGDPLPWCGCTLPTQCTRDNPGVLLSSELAVVVRSECTASMKGLGRALKYHSDLPAARKLTAVLGEWNRVGRKTGLYDSIYSLIFRALLRPSKELTDRLARMRGGLREIVPPRVRHFRKGDSRGYVSVHARIGYGTGEGQGAYGARFHLESKGASLRLIASCLAKTAAEEADDADLQEPQMFYVATDTPQFTDEFRSEIRRWSKRAVVKEMDRKVVHSSDMNGTSPEHREAFIMTGADLFFLSAGERLVSLHSWFANLAMFLGDVPHKTKGIEDCVRESDSLIPRALDDQNPARNFAEVLPS